MTTRGVEALFEGVKPKKDLSSEAIQLLKEERDDLEREVTALRLRCLAQDKKELKWARAVRAAEEDAEVLLEAVSELARVVTNSRREEREIRERVRKLLESHKIPPPTTLGSSRKRGKRGSGTTESA
jgi:seryl-tRNA synthetase